jgi:putative FmdB family regulatory protein
MPTYEYVCKDCGHEFERFQSITARPIRKCPDCGKAAAKRLIGTGSGIIFKGSGFYETDYRSESYKKAQKSEKGEPPKKAAEKKTDTKAKESKPADKSKAKSKDKKKSA